MALFRLALARPALFGPALIAPMPCGLLLIKLGIGAGPDERTPMRPVVVRRTGVGPTLMSPVLGSPVLGSPVLGSPVRDRLRLAAPAGVRTGRTPGDVAIG